MCSYTYDYAHGIRQQKVDEKHDFAGPVTRRNENDRSHPRQSRERRARWGILMKQRAEKWILARVISKTFKTWPPVFAATTGSTYFIIVSIVHVVTATESNSSGSSTANTGCRSTVCIQRVTAATPYNSYVRVNSTTNSMLQHRHSTSSVQCNMHK